MVTTKDPKFWYKNARHANPEIAEEINEKAKSLVERVFPTLKEVKENPELANHGKPETNGHWRRDYITDTLDTIEKLYQSPGLEEVQTIKYNVPSEVTEFIQKAEEYKPVGASAPGIFFKGYEKLDAEKSDSKAA